MPRRGFAHDRPFPPRYLQMVGGCTINFGFFSGRRNKTKTCKMNVYGLIKRFPNFFRKKLTWYLFFAPFFVFNFLVHFLRRVLRRNVKIYINSYIFPSDGPITCRKKIKYKIKHHIRPHNTLDDVIMQLFCNNTNSFK